MGGPDGHFSEPPCTQFYAATNIFPEAQLANLRDLLQVAEEFRQRALVNSLREKSCSPKGLPRPSLITKMSPSLEELESVLEEGKAVGISYTGGVLLKHHRGQKQPSNHASIISGMVQSCGKRYYILRSTWGQGPCGRLSPAFSGGVVPYFCDAKGNFLVSREYLEGQIDEMTWITNDP